MFNLPCCFFVQLGKRSDHHGHDWQDPAFAYLACVLNSAMFDEMCAEQEGEGSPYDGFFEKGDEDLPF